MRARNTTKVIKITIIYKLICLISEIIHCPYAAQSALILLILNLEMNSILSEISKYCYKSNNTKPTTKEACWKSVECKTWSSEHETVLNNILCRKLILRFLFILQVVQT